MSYLDSVSPHHYVAISDNAEQNQAPYITGRDQDGRSIAWQNMNDIGKSIYNNIQTWINAVADKFAVLGGALFGAVGYVGYNIFVEIELFVHLTPIVFQDAFGSSQSGDDFERDFGPCLKRLSQEDEVVARCADFGRSAFSGLGKCVGALTLPIGVSAVAIVNAAL